MEEPLSCSPAYFSNLQLTGFQGRNAASGEEEAWIDLDTLRGYKRTVLCEGVRDEVACNLGEEPNACAELLQGVVQRRLLPTPWLNQVST